MNIAHLAKVIGFCDATHESAANATARFALYELTGWPSVANVDIEDNVRRLGDILEAYAFALQQAGVQVNGADTCKGEH